MLKRIILIGLIVTAMSVPSFGDISLSGTSYVQDFNNNTLATGWSVRTGATASSLGSAVSFGTATTWAAPEGRFFSGASVTGLSSTANTAIQNAATDRTLSIRQTQAFGDPGAAFVLRLNDTLGFQNFQASFDAEMQSVQSRTTTWRFEYGIGSAPTTFTSLGNVTLGTVFGESANSFSFGNALNNISGPVFLRVVTLSDSTGTDSRDTFGIDNFRLEFSAVPEPASILLLGVAGVGGLAFRRFRRKAVKSEAVAC